VNKTTSCSYTVKQIIKFMRNGRFTFDFPIQRDADQWTKEQKSLFICSIIQGYDIPDIYIINDDVGNFDKDSILDGKQRLTNIFDYSNDMFKLSKNIKPITIDGIEYDISGMLFSQLPEDVRNEFFDYSIRARRMNGFTNDEIEEQFFRLNNGCVFTNAQRANVKLGTELSEEITRIANDNFFKYKASFSNSSIKKAEPISCVLQTLMVMTGYDYSSLSANEVLKFSQILNEECKNNNQSYSKAIDRCKYLYAKMYVLLNTIETKKVLKKIHILPLIMSLNEAEVLLENNDITDDKYIEFLSYWIEHGIYKERYKKYCGCGSTKKDRVDGRISVIIDELMEFITL